MTHLPGGVVSGAGVQKWLSHWKQTFQGLQSPFFNGERPFLHNYGLYQRKTKYGRIRERQNRAFIILIIEEQVYRPNKQSLINLYRIQQAQSDNITKDNYTALNLTE